MSANDTFHAAQQVATALLNGADPADVVVDASLYGEWAGTITYLVDAYSHGSTPAVQREFEVMVQKDKDIAALVAGSCPRRTPTGPTVPPLPAAATAVYDRALPCAAWLDTYCRFAIQAAPMSTANFHEAAGVFAASVAIGRRMALRVGTDAIYPNLFFLFIAPSTLYLKSTSFKVLHRLFHAADLTHMLLPQRMTPETLTQELGTTIPATFPNWHELVRDRWIRERAFAAQRGWMLDEASRLLNSLKRDFNTGMTELILDLYKCPDEISDQTISRGRTLVQHAYLSFFGATTPMSAAPHIANEELWHNGWWARFLLLTTDTVPDWAFFPPEMATPGPVIDGLHHIANLFPTPQAQLVERATDAGERQRAIEVFGQTPPQSVVLAPGVYAAWETYTKAVRYDLLRSGAVPDVLWSCYGRLGTHLIKVAMCLAVMDAERAPVVIELRHLARAQQMIERWRAALHTLRIEGMTTREAKTSDKVLVLLADAGSEGLLARDVYRPLGIKAAEARAILDELLLAGQVIKSVTSAPNGKTIELWRIPPNST